MLHPEACKAFFLAIPHRDRKACSRVRHVIGETCHWTNFAARAGDNAMIYKGEKIALAHNIFLHDVASDWDSSQQTVWSWSFGVFFCMWWEKSTHLHSDVSGSIDHTQLPEHLSAEKASGGLDTRPSCCTLKLAKRFFKRTTSCCMTWQVIEIVPARLFGLGPFVSSLHMMRKIALTFIPMWAEALITQQLPENLSAREGFWRTLTLGPHVAPWSIPHRDRKACSRVRHVIGDMS